MIINELVLYSNDLLKVKDFYAKVLGIPIIHQDLISIQFELGSTKLTFEYRKKEVCPYHFAMNIPSNMENEVLNWLSERSMVLPYLGKSIVDFSDWNAKAIYSLDYNGNIIEFIARKNLNIQGSGGFDGSSIQCVSEIGLSCDNIEEIFFKLKKVCGIPFYYGSMVSFCAAGDELGLFILVDSKKRFWFPTKTLALAENFKTIIQEGTKRFRIEYENKLLNLIEL